MKALSLYIHSPFCRHKCGYCDFNSWDEQRIEPQQKWLEGIKKEIKTWKQNFPKDTTITTCFMGGGTPSLLSPQIWEELVVFLKDNFNWAPDYEWTLEANPEDISEERLHHWKQLGLNRISLGIQSFESKFLERLERKTNPLKNIQALSFIQKNWGPNWSLDLMYALPGQTLQEWENDLKKALEFSPNHISTYQLTLTTERSKNWEQAPEDDLHEFYKLKKEILEPLGYQHYEISNFSKKNFESRHNLVYWEIGSFLGLGPGAYGLLDGSFFNSKNTSRFGRHIKNPSILERWLEATEDFSLIEKGTENRSAEDHLKEILMMGLRLQCGINCERLPQELIQYWTTQAAYWGHLERLENGYFRATEKGRQVLDFILKKMFKDLDSLSLGLDSEKIDPIFGK